MSPNEQVTTVDINHITGIFVEAGFGSAEDIDAAAEEHQGLGLFLRSVIGLDDEAADTPQGPDQLFPKADIDAMETVLDLVRGTAQPT